MITKIFSLVHKKKKKKWWYYPTYHLTLYTVNDLLIFTNQDIYTWLNSYVDSISVGEPEVFKTVQPEEVHVTVVLWEAVEHCGAVPRHNIPGHCPLKRLEEKCKTLVPNWMSTWKLNLVSRKWAKHQICIQKKAG